MSQSLGLSVFWDCLALKGEVDQGGRGELLEAGGLDPVEQLRQISLYFRHSEPTQVDVGLGGKLTATPWAPCSSRHLLPQPPFWGPLASLSFGVPILTPTHPRRGATLPFPAGPGLPAWTRSQEAAATKPEQSLGDS